MEHVLWVGGPPGSGKTTVARRLARKHGLRLYSSDTRTWDHRDRALAAQNEAAMRWEALTPEERQTDPHEMLRMSLHHERAQMVLDDVAAMPTAPLIVAEGTCLPAPAASTRPGHAVWLAPTEEFQQTNLAARSHVRGTLEMYRLLTDVIASDAQVHGIPTIRVDGVVPVATVVAAVEEVFAAVLAVGPHASTTAERRRLLHEVNQDIVAQVRGFYGRRWATGDPESVVQSFVCECGDEACTLEVSCTVAEAAAGPGPIASGHVH